MNRPRFLVASALAAATLMAPTVAAAQATVTLELDGVPVEDDSTGYWGQNMHFIGEGCPGTPEDPSYMGVYFGLQMDPMMEQQGMPAEKMTVDGGVTADMEIPVGSGAGPYYMRFYCSSAPSSDINDESMLMWLSVPWTITVEQSASPDANRSLVIEDGDVSVSDGGSVRISVDPDALPPVDKMDIFGGPAAQLKARVDAKVASVAPVQRLYQAFLGRNADHAGLDFWVGELERGVPVSRLAARFAGTSEFRNGRGSLSDGAFVDALYRTILDRGPDAAGRQYWTDRLGNGTMSRASMVVAFANSVENVRRTANTSYVVAAHYELGGSTPSRATVAEQAAQLSSPTALKVELVEEIALSIDDAASWNQLG